MLGITKLWPLSFDHVIVVMALQSTLRVIPIPPCETFCSLVIVPVILGFQNVVYIQVRESLLDGDCSMAPEKK